MNRAGACLLEHADHMHDVERFAVTGVAVDQQWQPRGAHDLADKERDLVDRNDAKVREPHRGRHGSARQIQRFKTRGLGLQRRHAVMGARQAKNTRALQQCAKAATGAFLRQIGCDEVGHAVFP